ncbi:hypothetical protein K1719_016472 [Acacia pycnantha]|nr:hypothetical protein K1719_016472 [Acacia pycnantha]
MSGFLHNVAVTLPPLPWSPSLPWSLPLPSHLQMLLSESGAVWYYVHKFLLGVITLIRLRIVIPAAPMSFSMVSAFKGLSLASSSSSFFFKGDSGSFNVASKPLSILFPNKFPLTIQNGHKVIGAVLNSTGIGGQSTGGVANGTQSSSENLSTQDIITKWLSNKFVFNEWRRANTCRITLQNCLHVEPTLRGCGCEQHTEKSDSEAYSEN